MSTPGYQISIKKSGVSTSFTGEACSNTTGNTYQIDDTNKRVFDRDVTPTFYANGVAILPAAIASIDYLYGKVTFTGSETEPITVDGAYMPMFEVAGCKEGTLNRTSAIHDYTDTSNVGYHTKMTGLHDVTITVGRFDDISHAFTDLIVSRTPFVIEFSPAPTKTYRGWFICENSGQNLDLNALIEESLSFQLAGNDELGKTFSRSDQ